MKTEIKSAGCEVRGVRFSGLTLPHLTPRTWYLALLLYLTLGTPHLALSATGPPGVFIPGGGGAGGTNTVQLAAGYGITVVTQGLLRTISLYAGPTISSFVNNRNTVEVGTTITSTTLDWVLAGAAITSQSLDNSIGARPIGDRTYTHTSTYTTDRTYVLTVSDGVTSPTANSTVLFQSKAYWGLSTQTTLTDAQIRALSQEFATARQRTKTITVATENTEYIYLIWPASFGLVDRFVVDGFNNTAWTLEGGAAQDFVNAAGATVSYYVYRSNLPSQIGEFEIEIE